MVDIPAGKTVILKPDGADRRVFRGTGFTGALFQVQGQFSLEGDTGNTVEIDGERKTAYNSLIHVVGGIFTLRAGTITGNEYLGVYGGGGVSVSAGTFSMNGGEISGNTASRGGGVYVEGGAFRMNRGEISGNTASTNGGGVYVDYMHATLFEMGGGEITGNDVYLSGSSTVALTGTLPAAAAVVLTPETYSKGRIVLTGDSTLLSSEYRKFSITPESGVTWYLYRNGSIHTAEISTADELSELIDNIPANGIPHEILINSSMNVTTELTIAPGQNIILKGTGTITVPVSAVDTTSTTSEMTLFDVRAGATLTFSGITVRSADYVNAEVSVFRTAGEVIMESGEISGFGNNGDGPCVVSSGGSFTMNGGTISGNKVRYGGGVFVSSGGTFTMTGGTISGNHAVHDGKAVRVGGSFNWTGGTILGNTGAGVAVSVVYGGTLNNTSGNTAS